MSQSISLYPHQPATVVRILASKTVGLDDQTDTFPQSAMRGEKMSDENALDRLFFLASHKTK